MTSRHEAPAEPAGRHGMAWKRDFRRRLLRWYASAARDLPWRRTRDPYAIWVSEIMLQQTQVQTVVPYYVRFLERFPTIDALAAAGLEEVLHSWEGLGYYRRAQQLHAAAQQLVRERGGQFPARLDETRALPGIGRYTAGAILSIAFGAPLPVLEANTLRLYSRLLASREPVRSAAAQKRLWAFAEGLLPRRGVGKFNQALMELGSQLCTPREPDCARCPVAALCPTRAEGLQEVIPPRGPRLRYESVREIAVVIRQRGRVLLRQCLAGERWAGLWDFPRFGVDGGAPLAVEIAARAAAHTGCRIRVGRQLACIRHGVTRFRITLECFEAELLRVERRWPHMRWLPVGQLGQRPLSVTGRRIARLLADAPNG